MDSKDILKNALLQYTGTLVVVSHDRDFLQGLTDELYEFRDGAVHEFKGDIFEFLESRSASLQATIVATQSHETEVKTQGRLSYEQSKDRERELRKLRNAVEKVEKEISDLEEQIAAKEAQLASGTAQDADFYSQYQSLKDRLDERMEAWENATIALEEFQN